MKNDNDAARRTDGGNKLSWQQYIRFIRDVKYDLMVPPLGLDFNNMTPKQAGENFEWFLSKIPERMEYFRTRCASDLSISPDSLSFTAESLIPVWKWFLNTARMEKTPAEELKKMKEGAKLFGDSFINRKQFTVATTFIMRDIGIYVGQCYVLNYKNLYWHYSTKPKNEINVNQPVIAGFRVKIINHEGDAVFNPISFVEGRAANLYDKTQDAEALYKLYTKWIEYVPE